MFLSAFQERKLNENNVWHASIIDQYEEMLIANHPYVKDLKVAAKSLVAMTNVFAKRTDLSHKEVVRLSNHSMYDNSGVDGMFE